MCGHLDFLWPFASQKKQTNVDFCSQLTTLFWLDFGVSTDLSIFEGFGVFADLGVAILADIPIAAAWQFCCLILPARSA
jgi:hypothetical protein